MLFRAPGLSHIKSEATPVNITEALKKDSDEGFKQASEDLIINLDIQLQQFKEKVKQNTKEYNITNRPGYTGGGSVDTFFLLFTIIASGGYGLWRNLHKKG
ncbi:MAG: rhombotarget lipoprotein, partial [Campylobacterota bacterium]